jgi:hypothetical protein
MSFGTAVTYPAGQIPEAVQTADFNGDGRLDLAVANYKSSFVSVLLGNPDGTFQPARNSVTGIRPVSIATGDFNDDGKLDLATANVAYGDVSVLLGNGDGTFGAHTDYGRPLGNPISVAVGDFNSDGKLDLGVMTNTGYSSYYGSDLGGAVAVLTGNGDGSFVVPNQLSWLSIGWHTSAAVADFNGDGRLDFAATHPDYASVDLVFGDGTGAFGGLVSVQVGSGPRSVTSEDVNGDGNVDLVTANSGDKVSVLLGSGLGTFAGARDYAVGAGPYSVATADFNRDGKVDLVTANELAGTVSVLFGAGTGSFGWVQDFAVGAEPQSLAVGDFNGDHFPDLAVANERSDNVSVLLNDQSWPPADSPTVAISDVTVTEGNTGTVGAEFTVSLSAAYNQPVSVNYATVDGSATVAGGDYRPVTGTLTFGVGETSKTVTVPVNGDRVAEYTELFSLRLASPVNAFIPDPTATGTITDDEPYVSVWGATVAEGNTGTRAASLTVSLASVYDADVVVSYSTADGGAVAGSDYEGVAGTLTIPAGQTSQTVRVLISGDRVVERTEYTEYDSDGYPYSRFEDNEYFLVNISSSEAKIGYGQARGVIQDDEPRLSINSVSLKEGRSGTQVMTFTVTLSAAYDQAVTVSYATSDGSATVADNDYVATSGTLTFAPGQMTKTVTVVIKGDKKKESDESFYVLLSAPSSNALISNATGWGAILNDDR